MPEDFDTRVKLLVYTTIAETGRPPLIREMADTVGVHRDEIAASLSRLRERKLVFLARESGEIVMAPPFSAVPTPFNVVAGGLTYYANCVWDAYGVAAALHRDANIEASCGCCGEPMRLEVRADGPVPGPGVAHFAVPARQWWDDLTYT